MSAYKIQMPGNNHPKESIQHTGRILSFPHPTELDGNKAFQFMTLHSTVPDI